MDENLEHIIVVDDEQHVLTSLKQRLNENYGDRYVIAPFLTAEAAIKYANAIDLAGQKLALIISDEKMNTMQGHEFLAHMTGTHPLAKKILNSAYQVQDALSQAIDSGLDGFATKTSRDTVGDDIFRIVDKVIAKYEQEPSLSFTKKGITFSQADTLFKKNAFFGLRYEVYLEEGHKTHDMFRDEEHEAKKEWDEHDLGGIDKLIISPHIRYLVAMKGSECIGGVRIIDGDLPMETGKCVSDFGAYKKDDILTLDRLSEVYPDTDIYKREISRLIVHPEHRASYALFGLFRMIEQLTKEQETMFCTARPNTIGLYEAVGFETIGPNILYSLANEWTPLMRNRWKAHNEPESIGMDERAIGLHKIVTRPIRSDDAETWARYSEKLNEAAIETGYYNAKR